ncbi:MAG: hypothetical protein R3F61_09825 [Myxococcota bacterium]
MWMLAASSLAASPGGFQVGPGLPVRSVELREAVAIDPDWVSQSTLAARTDVGGRVSVMGELPVVVAGGSSFDVGLGQLRLGSYLHLGRRKTSVFSLGLEASVRVAPNTAVATSWATVRRDTVPAGEALAVGMIATRPDGPLCLRVAVGFRSGQYERFEELGIPYFVGEVGFVGVQPVAGRTSVVGELLAMVDSTPLSLRALARFDLDPLTVDVGLQAGIPLGRGLTFGPVASVRRFF